MPQETMVRNYGPVPMDSTLLLLLYVIRLYSVRLSFLEVADWCTSAVDNQTLYHVDMIVSPSLIVNITFLVCVDSLLKILIISLLNFVYFKN